MRIGDDEPLPARHPAQRVPRNPRQRPAFRQRLLLAADPVQRHDQRRGSRSSRFCILQVIMPLDLLVQKGPRLPGSERRGIERPRTSRQDKHRQDRGNDLQGTPFRCPGHRLTFRTRNRPETEAMVNGGRTSRKMPFARLPCTVGISGIGFRGRIPGPARDGAVPAAPPPRADPRRPTICRGPCRAGGSVGGLSRTAWLRAAACLSDARPSLRPDSRIRRGRRDRGLAATLRASRRWEP